MSGEVSLENGEKRVVFFHRKLLGPELVIVILTMPQNELKRRLQKRHFKKEEAKFVDYLMVRLGPITLDLNYSCSGLDIQWTRS